MSNQSLISDMGNMMKSLDSFQSQLSYKSKHKGAKIDKELIDSQLDQIMTWPLGAAADQDFIMGVQGKLKATYDGISASSVSGAPLRKRIEAAMKHVATFFRQADSYDQYVRQRSPS